MALKPVILTCKSPDFYRFSGISLKPTSHFVSKTRISAYPFQVCGFRSNSLANYETPSGLSLLGRSKIGFRQMGRDWIKVSAVDGGGAGGFGGGDSGDGDGGGGGGGDGENKKSLVSWYLALLKNHPVLTKAVTSALLNLVGDLICQLLIDKVPSLDLKRMFLFTFLGLALVGPTLHFWYLYLSKLVTTPGASGAFLRLVVDQFIFAPTFVGVFLSALLTLEGRPSQVMQKLQQDCFRSLQLTSLL
ncbi:Peroxisomal membrane protein MPV17 [Heracleum sosnowskyi]|uniref:Peroxisomal membrane protein MPV17 n=1 Tax=Heracleum sosnowskyi TaxID=360622 RepID=A0AAD8IM93_9APIA|nr:Peroxisomal membrane protein MPV17 [Heracleum sosnowskyi]